MDNNRLLGGVAWGLVALEMALLLWLGSPSTGRAGTLPPEDPRVFLPLLVRGHGTVPSPPPPPTATPPPPPTSTPPPSGLTILDRYGQVQDWGWVIEHFGAVTWDQGNGTAALRVLQELEGPCVLVAHVERGGQPVGGFPVMFYWPDAPLLDPSLQACGKDRALVIYTKDAGDGIGNAEFAMGGGSAYFPPDGGPHVVWVGGPGSDCLGGLGWLGGTNHVHLDSEWEVP